MDNNNRRQRLVFKCGPDYSPGQGEACSEMKAVSWEGSQLGKGPLLSLSGPGCQNDFMAQLTQKLNTPLPTEELAWLQRIFANT